MNQELRVANGEEAPAENEETEDTNTMSTPRDVPTILANIASVERAIDRTAHPLVLVLDHDTLVSNLSNEDPEKTWASPSGGVHISKKTKLYEKLEKMIKATREMAKTFGAEDQEVNQKYLDQDDLDEKADSDEESSNATGNDEEEVAHGGEL